MLGVLKCGTLSISQLFYNNPLGAATADLYYLLMNTVIWYQSQINLLIPLVTPISINLSNYFYHNTYAYYKNNIFADFIIKKNMLLHFTIKYMIQAQQIYYMVTQILMCYNMI